MKRILIIITLFIVSLSTFATQEKDSIYTPDSSKCQKRILDLSKRQCFFYKNCPIEVYVSIGEIKTDIGHYYQCFFTILNTTEKTITIDPNLFKVTLYRKGKAKKKSGFVSTNEFIKKFKRKAEKHLSRISLLENNTSGSTGTYALKYNKQQDTYGSNQYDLNINPYEKAQRYYNIQQEGYKKNLLQKMTLAPKEQINKQLFMKYIRKVDHMKMEVIINGINYLFDVDTNLKKGK